MLVTATTSGGLGAVGNCTAQGAGTDDTAAIQRAIATAQNTGDVVEFPVTHNATTGVPEFPMRYRCSTPLYIGGRKKLRLTGPGQIVFDAGVEGIIVNETGSTSVDIHLDGLNIYGGTSPIVLRGPHRARVTNCVIEGFTLYGVFIDSTGVAHNSIVQDCNIYAADGATATGIQILAVDSVARGNVIRGCDVGIYSNSPALWVTGNHIFPDRDTDGSTKRTTNYCIQLGASADHLVNIEGNYLDNAKLAFVDVNATGGPAVAQPRMPRDFDPGGGEQIRIRGNFMLIKDHPTTVKLVTGGPANYFDNVVRDNS